MLVEQLATRRHHPAPALGALEAEVIDLPRLTQQFGSGAALARMARMQSVSLAQGSPFTKAEASSQQFGQALHTQLFGDQQATGQHIAGQFPFAHGMMNDPHMGVGLGALHQVHHFPSGPQAAKTDQVHRPCRRQCRRRPTSKLLGSNLR